MKKTSICIFILLSFVYSCKNDNTVKKDTIKTKETKEENTKNESKELLQNPKEVILKLSENIDSIIPKTSVYDFVIGKVDLTLRNDNSYESELASAYKYWYNTGTYSISDNKITLQPTVCMNTKDGENIECSMTLGKSECYVVQKDDSIYYKKYIQCKSFENNDLLENGYTTLDFPVSDSVVKEGTEKLFDNKKIIIVNKKGIINKDTFVFTSIVSEINSEEGNQVYINEEIEVVAHTKDKYKLNGIENYWYLVSKNMFREFWIFGDSITITK